MQLLVANLLQSLLPITNIITCRSTCCAHHRRTMDSTISNSLEAPTSSFARMPPEILVIILKHLKSKDILSVKHTNSRFRKLVSQNAALICNSIVQNRYRVESALFRPELVGRWLVPRDPVILAAEAIVGRARLAQIKEAKGSILELDEPLLRLRLSIPVSNT